MTDSRRRPTQYRSSIEVTDKTHVPTKPSTILGTTDIRGRTSFSVCQSTGIYIHNRTPDNFPTWKSIWLLLLLLLPLPCRFPPEVSNSRTGQYQERVRLLGFGFGLLVGMSLGLGTSGVGLHLHRALCPGGFSLDVSLLGVRVCVRGGCRAIPPVPRWGVRLADHYRSV